MGDDQIRGGMIEIGDPNEEPLGDDPAVTHRVVIEYRERGVPWMLIPPLLMLAAVLAVFGAKFLEPERPRQATVAVVQSRPAAPAAATEPAPTPLPVPPEPAPTPSALAPAVEMLPAPALTTAAPESAPPDVAPPEARPFPRAEGIGFDPKALEAEAKAPSDPAVEPAANQGPGGEMAREADQLPPAAVADADKPAEVDPDLLPPDPRLARVRKAERVAEARRVADEERAEFHLELKRICARSGVRSGPAINELIDRYGTKPDPDQIKLATKHLGKTGRAVGAPKPARIALLRSLGFSEPYVLGDIIEQDSAWLLGDKDLGTARNGPRNKGEVAYYSALYLLSYPPNRPATASRAVSQPRAEAGTRPPRGAAAGFAPAR